MTQAKLVKRMSKVVFKLRCLSPNLKSTPLANRNYVNYIATREGVVKNKGMDHGLFGKLQDMCQPKDIINLDMVRKFMYENSKQNFYRGIISLKEEDAIKLQMVNRKAWEDMISYKMRDIGQKLDIPASSLEWVAAYHPEKDHPHLHIIFWNKEQKIKSPFIKPQIANNIRTDLIKYICKDELTGLYEDKADSKLHLKDGFKELLGDITPEEIEKAKKHILISNPAFCLKPLPFNKISNNTLLELWQRLQTIREQLPKKGRLNYAFLPIEMKCTIDDFIGYLIKSNKQINQQYFRYINCSRQIASLYTNDCDVLDDVETGASSDMYRFLGNALLGQIKELNRLESVQAMTSQMQFDFALELLHFIAQITAQRSSSKYYEGKYVYYGELSALAKKELYLSLRDRGFEHHGRE